jgi:hypothetical protein
MRDWHTPLRFRHGRYEVPPDPLIVDQKGRRRLRAGRATLDADHASESRRPRIFPCHLDRRLANPSLSSRPEARQPFLVISTGGPPALPCHLDRRPASPSLSSRPEAEGRSGEIWPRISLRIVRGEISPLRPAWRASGRNDNQSGAPGLCHSRPRGKGSQTRYVASGVLNPPALRLSWTPTCAGVTNRDPLAVHSVKRLKEIPPFAGVPAGAGVAWRSGRRIYQSSRRAAGGFRPVATAFARRLSPRGVGEW